MTLFQKDDTAGNSQDASQNSVPQTAFLLEGCSCRDRAAESCVEAPEQNLIARVVGCRSRRSGPVDFFQTDGLELAVGDMVMVETEAGVVLTKVLMTSSISHCRAQTGEFGPLPPVLGKAVEADILKAKDNEILSAEARTYCQECIRKREMDMKLVDVEIAHDRSKMAFYFTAPARIDFRELVKDLVHKYRTRIELRQIGVRHETQMVGAVGNCGMVCCCRRYLRKFAPVAIKMAKEQNVFLNPAKISGICGRLLCCLAYEQENYDEFYRRCPKLGKKYQTARGLVRVVRANMFRESVSIFTEQGEETEISLEEWQALEPSRPEAGAHHAFQRNNRSDRERGLNKESLPRRQKHRPDTVYETRGQSPEIKNNPSEDRNSGISHKTQNRPDYILAHPDDRLEQSPPADDATNAPPGWPACIEFPDDTAETPCARPEGRHPTAARPGCGQEKRALPDSGHDAPNDRNSSAFDSELWRQAESSPWAAQRKNGKNGVE